MMVTIYVTHLR